MTTKVKLYIAFTASFGLAFWGASEMWQELFGSIVRSLAQ